MVHLEIVLKILQQQQLYTKRSKCSFAVWKIEYLGHVISKDGVEMDQQKVESIKAWPIPKSVKELRGFLCLVGYYRRFIKGFGMISRPLTNLLKKNNFRWNDKSIMAFEQLKTTMSSGPLLTLPNFDEEFTIETDANNQGIRVILS